MDTIPAVFLVLGAAFVWLGLTAIVILRFRRRRNGPALAPSAAHPADHEHGRHGRSGRRLGRITARDAGAPARRYRLKVRKVRR